MQQRLAEQKLLKQNPFSKRPGLLNPTSPLTSGELQNPLNPLSPSNKASSPDELEAVLKEEQQKESNQLFAAKGISYYLR